MSLLRKLRKSFGGAEVAEESPRRPGSLLHPVNKRLPIWPKGDQYRVVLVPGPGRGQEYRLQSLIDDNWVDMEEWHEKSAGCYADVYFPVPAQWKTVIGWDADGKKRLSYMRDVLNGEPPQLMVIE